MEMYKVHVLDNIGKTAKIFVFSGNEIQNIENPNLFNDKEREFINYYNLEPIFIRTLIHKDDTVRIIKKKILQAIGTIVSYEELYLFSVISKIESPRKIFDAIYKGGKDYIDSIRFSQLLRNFDLLNLDVSKKNEYYYEDFLDVVREISPSTKKSLGIRFSKMKDETFSMNPFDIVKGYNYEGSSENAIMSFENSQLMNFTSGHKIQNNTIYVSYAEDIFDFLERNQNNVNEMIQYYFPILAKNNVHNKDDLLREKQKLIRTTKKMMDKKVFQLYENVDFLYDVYNERTSEIPYTEEGIKRLEICIHPSETQILPLDAIFKTIHSSEDVPFIKYNPGTRRENIYRIFSKQINKYGSKIPVLKRTKIIQLSKDIGKNKQISFYIPYSDYGNIVDILVVLSHHSNIYVEADFEKAKTVDEINEIMKRHVNPIIQSMNVFLNQTGYQLNVFENMYSDFVEVINMKYISRVPIKRKITGLNEGYISAIFDFIEEDIAKGAILKYKRVENYEEMSAVDEFILNWFNSSVETRKLNREEMIRSLIDYFDITRDEAFLKLDVFLRDHTISNGKYVNSSSTILENAGFLTKFSIKWEDDSFFSEVDNINSIHYVDRIRLYLDSIIRIKQYPTKTSIEKSRISAASRTMKHTNEVDKPHVETIIVPAFRVQPLRFEKIQEEEEDIEEETGFFFEDYGEDESDDNITDGKDDLDDFMKHLDEYQDATVDYEEIIPEISSEVTKDIDGPSPDGIIFDYENEDENEIESYEEKNEENSGGKGKRKEKEKEKESAIIEEQNNDSPNSNLDADKYEKQLDGMVLREKNNNIFFSRLKQKEPTLYLTTDQGKKYKRYSRLCQSSRQPVIISDEEKRNIDTNHKGSYTNALQYGTDPENKNWYICPKYWCLKTNTSITEKQVKSGMCGEIIPQDVDVVPPGHYVYEFGDTFNSPGFLTKENLHPDGYCLPCCFKEWNKKQQRDMRNKCIKGVPGKERATSKNLTILKIEAVPIEQDRMGFLPFNVQRFLQINNSDAVDPQNPSMLKPDGETFLRYGVEQDTYKSFIGCIADVYSKKKSIVPTVSISNMCDIIKNSLTIDIFIRVHNGTLPSVFTRPNHPSDVSRENDDVEYSPEIRETAFFKSINMANDSQKAFLDETIVAYRRFSEFLTADDSIVDYTFLWDIICSPNPKLFEVGLNLAILDVTENDSTDNIELICPASAYSKQYYDPKKETLILLKNEEIFEPIYLCNSQVVVPTFFENNVNESLKHVLQLIRNTTQNYCAPISSIRTYEFKRNKLAEEVRLNLLKQKYKIKYQIQNFQGKIIGFQVKIEDSYVFVPCLPSSFLPDIPIKNIEEYDLWRDYVTTRDILTHIHRKSNGEIFTNPVMKVIEDGLIVGILTETNQFIEINPPSENIFEDHLREMKGTNYIFTDKAISSGKEDSERIEMIRKITLESQFYSVFRSFIRILLNDYENRGMKKKITEYIENPRYTTRLRLRKVERLLRDLSEEFIEFHDYTDEVLNSLHEISNCQSESDAAKKYCLTRDGIRILLIPKTHLFSGANNESIYYSRIADEIIRYKRIQSFLLEPKTVLNITHTDYKINEDEMILLESLLTKDYFADLIPFTNKNENNSVNISFDNAHPRITQKYSDRVDYASQLRVMDESSTDHENEFDIMCIKGEIDIVGNATTNIWKKMFPKTAQEIVFNESRECSFYPILYILRDKYKSEFTISQVKETLRNFYKKYVSNLSYLQKIISILSRQGKKEMMDLVKRKIHTFEEVIMSEGYYLTNLDLWVLAHELKLPIVLFSSNKLKNLVDSITWIILGGKYTEKYYFIRAYTEPLPSTKYNDYHLVIPTLKISELKGLQNIVDLGSNGHPEYSKNVQSLETFLENYQIRRK